MPEEYYSSLRLRLICFHFWLKISRDCFHVMLLSQFLREGGGKWCMHFGKCWSLAKLTVITVSASFSYWILRQFTFLFKLNIKQNKTRMDVSLEEPELALMKSQSFNLRSNVQSTWNKVQLIILHKVICLIRLKYSKLGSSKRNPENASWPYEIRWAVRNSNPE